MATLNSFTFVTLNGFYKGTHEDISWHQHGGEEEGFSKDSLQADNILLFGRTTYEMMAGFWPTQAAMDAMPEVAAGMNKAEKLVVSSKLKSVSWSNTTILTNKWLEDVRKLKQGNKNITVLGSGSILTQLIANNLVDYVSVMIDPVAIGKGAPLFTGLQENLTLTLLDSRVFKSGVILLNYKPNQS